MTVVSARALAAIALAGTIGATPAPPPMAKPTPVSEFVVTGGPAPKVSASYPADGAEVPAGVLVLKIVFDQPMTPGGWSYGRSGTVDFPGCLAKPRLLADQRTFVLLCTVAPHKTYALEINAVKDFASASGRPAAPTVLRFSTGDTDSRYLHDALQQAGLTDADDPIMGWRDTGGGVSASSLPPTAQP